MDTHLEHWQVVLSTPEPTSVPVIFSVERRGAMVSATVFLSCPAQVRPIYKSFEQNKRLGSADISSSS